MRAATSRGLRARAASIAARLSRFIAVFEHAQKKRASLAASPSRLVVLGCSWPLFELVIDGELEIPAVGVVQLGVEAERGVRGVRIVRGGRVQDIADEHPD